MPKWLSPKVFCLIACKDFELVCTISFPWILWFGVVQLTLVYSETIEEQIRNNKEEFYFIGCDKQNKSQENVVKSEKHNK